MRVRVVWMHHSNPNVDFIICGNSEAVEQHFLT